MSELRTQVDASASPERWRDRAQAAADQGDLKEARALLERGCRQFSGNAALANSAGHFAMRDADPEAARGWFAEATEASPEKLEYALNHAIALARLGEHEAALAILRAKEEAGQNESRYCSARATAERETGDPGAAASWYDRCLALSPTSARALHGRARISLERGEHDAISRFERALAANSTDAELWLGYANALDAGGDAAKARQIVEQLIRQAPHWIEALRLLAQLRLAVGEDGFADHCAEAARLRPDDPAIPLAHIDILAGLDHAQEAAEIAGAARRRFPHETRFTMLEAVQAGSAGDDDRAEAIFARLALETSERMLHEARHRIRTGEPERAAQLLDRAGANNEWSISIWALRGIVWRLLDDPRADWLHGQPGLMRSVELPEAGAVLAQVVPLLHRLHDGSPMPLGQSLRGGTQTRGNLFARIEPELAQLEAALAAALEQYRQGLPPFDPSHPLLRNRDARWRIAGSWSVRLCGGGDFHTAHIHPQGVVSSALHCEVSEQAWAQDETAGWLELGRPARDLRLDLPPLASFRPEPGKLVLFPSTLYHGTRPFPVGRRLTVAFDVNA